MSSGPRVAVFSDVHGNLPALQAVWDAIRQSEPFDEIIAAGDHCLNGPKPAKSLDLVVAISTAVLYGNTDRDIVTMGDSDPDLGTKKADSISWTRDQLGEERIRVLSDLRFEARVFAPDGTALQVVHANPQDVDRHIFPDMSDEDLRVLLGETHVSMLAFGHLHIPFVRRIDDLTLVNIAAAGNTRDGDRRATWGEFTWDADGGWSAQTHRVEYDIEETVRQMYASGMPHPEKRAQDLLRATYE
jgi:putative phosphoesterase